DVELPGPACFTALRGGANQSFVERGSMNRGEQNSWGACYATVETELADCNIVRQGLGVGRADRRQQPKCNRQIVMRSFLRKIRRGQVDRNHLGWKREPDRRECRPDTLTALGDRFVRQANDGELGHARRELNLHLDGAGFEPEVSDSSDGRGHQAPSPRCNTLRRLPPSSAEKLDRHTKTASWLVRWAVCHH